MPRISFVRRCLNWPFAMLMAAYGAPMFFCRTCGRCQWPSRKRAAPRTS
jgi:hypothetical protein